MTAGDTQAALPVLYSFRRCPYAMRARLGLAAADIAVELREILLKRKPDAMLAVSPKGTVPVLVLSDGQVLDESIDVLRWALAQRDPHGWLDGPADDMQRLIAANDGAFKTALDHYKYSARFPERSQEDYRDDADGFLSELEQRLAQHDYLCGHQRSMADVAIFPFIRQVSGVERDWWASQPYPALHAWLARHLEWPLFKQIMRKYGQWLDRETDAGPLIERWSAKLAP